MGKAPSHDDATMTTLTDRPLTPGAGRDPGESEQALFAEARRRRQRRWLTGIVITIPVAAAVAVASLTWPPGPGARHGAGSGIIGADASGQPAVVAWVDGLSRLHVGVLSDAARLRQRVATEANAAPLSLVTAGRRVYWVDPAGTYVPSLGYWSQVVRYLDLRTGRTGLAGAGQTVFTSAGGNALFMSQSPSVLAEYRLAGGRARTFNLPHGWYLPGGDGSPDVLSGAGLATADGIVVQSRASPGVGPRMLALWQPGSRTVTVIGRGRGALAAYTPPGSRYSLLAWLPAACRPPGSCLVRILNTASGATWTIRSPSAGGFAYGGAFSPGGTTLAVFVASPSRRAVRLALIDVAAGTIRLAARTWPLGLDFGWVTWLPGGHSLLAGTGPGYLVDAATLAVRPVRMPGSVRGQGPDYSSVIVPGQS